MESSAGEYWSDEEIKILLQCKSDYSSHRWVKEAIQRLNRSNHAIVSKAFKLHPDNDKAIPIPSDVLLTRPVLEWFGFWSGDGIRCCKRRVGLCNSDLLVLAYFIGIGEKYLNIRRNAAHTYVSYPEGMLEAARVGSQSLDLIESRTRYYLNDRFTAPHYQVVWGDDRLAKSIHNAKALVASIIDRDWQALLSFIRGRCAADGIVYQATKNYSNPKNYDNHKIAGIAVKSGVDSVFLTRCLGRLGLPEPSKGYNSLYYRRYKDLRLMNSLGLMSLHPRRQVLLNKILASVKASAPALIALPERRETILAFIETLGRPVSAAEISAKFGYSYGHAPLIVKEMAAKGLLVSIGKYRRHWALPNLTKQQAGQRIW